ncbi:MAG: type II toxin-antitoxin system Phd/YefM family antitoxin [Acidobacteria bacterium]|nr:type II toxin-antitoxin system Phd/YefM family antitoxin [Acidobacteriota bacterium]
MTSIGIRELRQRASECVRLVEAGRTLQVTSRGRTVALLVPSRRGGRRDLLVTRGRLVPGTGDLLDLGRPLRPAQGVPTPSALLQRARENER